MQVLSLMDFLKLSWQKRKLLFIIGFCTAIGASIVAMFIPVYYKSTTTIFPVKLSQAPVNETALRRGNIMDFGETGEAEQTIEILNSNRLVERLIDKFDLYSHYGFTKGEALARTEVMKQYYGNVDVKRNKFNTISITVWDKNAQMAADIANTITAYLDTIKYEITQVRAKSLINNLNIQAAKQQIVVDSVKALLTTFTEKGVMSQFQRGYLIQAYAEASLAEKNRLKQLVEENIKYGEDFDRVERSYERELESQTIINKYLIQAKADADVMFSQKFIVEDALVPEKKSYPLRMVLVLVSVISSIVIALMLFIIRTRWPLFLAELQS
jgi:tyrosine-protein kinase Etk/Wzc